MNNTWTGLQTFSSTVGAKLQRTGTPLGDRTDKLENIGGNLYFNGVVLASSSSAGTVTSVGLSVPAILSVSGSPVTASGTLAVTLATQNANKVWAGPSSGGDAAPTFRALVAADLPGLSGTYLTASSTATLTNKSGNISQWTNDSVYITSSVATLSSLTSIGTITTGAWHGTVVAGQYGGTGVANTGRTVTLAGNITTAADLITSGANSLTFTTTGATNVTLPTTGTLATTAATTLSSLASVGTITTGVWSGTAVGATKGGTGQTVYAVGDILYASTTTVLSKLADIATGNVLISGGVGVAPSYGKVALASAVSGTLPSANGGTGVSTAAITDGQILIGKTADHTLNVAAITGTANQVVVTNGGGTIGLSLPQSIATASTPQWARIGLGTGAGSSAVITTTGQFDLGFLNDGNCGASDTVDWDAGQIHKSTLTAATCTYTFSNPVAGAIYTLLVIQDGTGGRLVTWPASVKWPAATAPTLTATASKIDRCQFTWDGTSYLGSCTLNF